MTDLSPARVGEGRKTRAPVAVAAAAFGAALVAALGPAAFTSTAQAAPAAAPPGSYAVKGIDVSHYQHEHDVTGARTPVSWSVVAKSHSFVFHKATQGTTRTDPYFEDDFAAAGRTSLLQAPYHFFDPKDTNDGVAQARHFIKSVRSAGYRGPSAGQLPPAVDIEEIRGKCPTALRSGQIKAFMNEVTKAFGVAPIVYTNAAFVDKCLGGKDQVLSGHVQWLSRYNATQEPPKVPGTDRTWTFWQHTDKGRTAGIEGAVDLDVFRGTPAQLRALAGR